jgi:hypothetical protein
MASDICHMTLYGLTKPSHCFLSNLTIQSPYVIGVLMGDKNFLHPVSSANFHVVESGELTAVADLGHYA